MARYFRGMLAALLFAAGTLVAGDFAAERTANWHQWRGPEANGLAPAGDPPVEWSATKNVKWKAEIPGGGKSSPIVWGNRIYLTTAVNTGKVVEGLAKPEDQPMRPFGIKFPNTLFKYVVLCLDRETGQIVWEKTAIEELPHEGHHGDNSFATPSAVTDGSAVYVSFGSRGLYCYTLDGELKWSKKLPNVSTRLSFGEGSSPVVHEGTVVLVRDNDSASRILAFDAQTGDVRWEKPRDEMSAWATPLIVEHSGRTQVITNSSRRVRSYDLATGDVIWEAGGQVSNVTPSPVRYGDHVICMSGYRGSAAFLLPLDAMGDITGSERIAWKFDRDTPYVPSPLLYGDKLYFNKLNTPILTVLDAKTGKPLLDQTRLPGLANVYSSPVGAGDRVYFTSREGKTLVIKNAPQLEVLATNALDDLIDASAAIAGKQMFLRGQKHVYCLEAR